MTRMQVLADSSFVYPLYDKDDSNHPLVRQVAAASDVELIIPNVVLTEVAFLFRREGGSPAVMRFFHTLATEQPRLEAVTYQDFRTGESLLQKYYSAELDFVDCCIIAIAERLNITHIATFDRRDFTIVRPAHSAYFELLP